MQTRQDNIYQDALPRLAEGVRKANAIVSCTMGPRGTNVILEVSQPPFARTTNDGATIIKALELIDPIEKMGLGFVKEVVERSNDNSGDGSSTTCAVLDSLLEEGIKVGKTGMELKRSLDECLPLIEQSLREQTKQITVEDIPAVARIAGENEELAAVLGEIYKTIGKDGIVHLEGSGTYETSFNLIEGVRFVDTGYLSADMAYDEQAKRNGVKETKAVYKNPAILVTKNKIRNLGDIDPLLKALIAQGQKTLVIYTNDMDSDAARVLINLQKDPNRKINILIIKAAAMWGNYIFEDFAKCVGATIIEDTTGTGLGRNMKLDWLGTCETLICDKEEVTLVGTRDISEHVAELEKEGTTDAKRRLSWLTTKTAILKLGSKSETELSYLMLKAEDAVHSSRLALKHGIVPGGGIALLNASKVMPDTIGGNIMKIALRAPLKNILKNAGTYDITFGELQARPADSIGFDAENLRTLDMFEAGIVDATSIVLGAVRNALGIASTILTASSVVILPPKSQEELINSSVMRPAYYG